MLNKKILNDVSLRPKSAIIIYAQGNEDDYYLENRKIQQTSRGYEMMAGIPLKKETLSAIVSELETSTEEKLHCEGLFPSKLIYYNSQLGKEHVIWKVSSNWQFLSFDKKLGIKNKQFLIPTLIFELKGNGLRVYAVKTENVKPCTQLFKAPFHNIGNNHVCMGTAQVKKTKELKKLMSEYEKGFFSSKFTELHGGSTIEGNLNTYLESTNKIEKKVLTKTKLKLEDLI